MRFATLMLASLLLAACATNPYQRMGTGGTIGGYDESLIKPGQYRVTYQGQGEDANDANVYKSFLRRCADLAKQNGSPYFKVTEGIAGAKHQGNLYAQVSIPNYTGTLTLLHKSEEGALVTADVLAQYAEEDAKREAREKAAIERSKTPNSNPFKTGGS